jgi:hypothetical protein
MFRSVAASFLLLPMLFSGLSVVCGEPQSTEEETEVATEVSESVPGECDGTMCRMMKGKAGPGPTCLLSGNGKGIAVFDMGPAIPCAAVDARILLPAVHGQVAEFVFLYSPPSLSSLTRPPEA